MIFDIYEHTLNFNVYKNLNDYVLDCFQLQTQITFIVMYFNNQIIILQIEIQPDICRAQWTCKLIW